MKVWIQHQNLFIEEIDCTSQEEIMHAYQSYDWNSELKKEEENKGSDRCCRPAFGIEVDTNHTIQFYPRKEGLFDLHYDYSVIVRKWVIFLHQKNAFLSVEGIKNENLDEILYLHYNTEHQLLMEFLEAFGDTKVLES